MDANQAIQAGMSAMDSFFGKNFTLDGITGTFVGVLNSSRKAQRLGSGGFREDIDGILVARKTQFADKPPYPGQRLMLEGRRYVIDATDEDNNSWSMQLMGEN